MTNDLRRQIHERLGREIPDPGLRARVIRTMAAEPRPSDRPRWRLATGIAVAVAIAATSVLLVTVARINNPRAHLSRSARRSATAGGAGGSVTGCAVLRVRHHYPES